MGTVARAGAVSSPRTLAKTNRTAHENHRKTDRTRLIALIATTALLFHSAAVVDAIDISIDPNSVEKGSGHHVVFECVGATGTIRWKFNGKEIVNGPGEVGVNGPSKRVLHEPDIADGGQYACFVGKDESPVRTLVVYTVPVISAPPQNESVHVGQDAHFSAQLENFYGKQNKASALWQRLAADGIATLYDQIVNGTSTGYKNVTYTLRNASALDNTTFQFVLFSPYFTVRTKFRLTVEPLTTVIPPGNLMFPRDDITDSSFKLTWFYQEGSEPIDKFTFHYESSTSSLREKDAGPRSLSLTFTGMRSCTTYRIYGIAVGTMGQVSEKSDVVSVTTRLTPLEDSQIWSDGDRVIVHYEGKSLPLCVTNNLTYHHHQAAKLCSLAAKLPPKGGKGGATSAFQTEMTFTTESSSFRSLFQSCIHEEKSGCTGNGRLISLRDLCPTPSTKAPTTAPDDQKGLSTGAVIGLVIGIIVVVVLVIVVIVWLRRKRRDRGLGFQSASIPQESNLYEEPDSPPLATNEDEEAYRNGKVVEIEPQPIGSSPSPPQPPKRERTPPAPLDLSAHPLLEKQTAAASSRVSENGGIKRVPRRRSFIRQQSLASGKSPSTENLTNSPLSDAQEEDDFEPSPTRTGEPTLKKESPRGQMRSHSVDYAIDIRVSPPQDSSDLHGTNTEDEFATDTNASSFQEHNIMYDLLERVKVVQQQVDELVGKQDEDAKESRESLKKIEYMQKQLQDVLSSRLPPPVPVNQYHHVRRSSEPLPLKAKSHSPPKQRPVNPPSPLVMPENPSFEAFPAPNQAKGRSEHQRGGSQSSITSVVSVGDIQKMLNDFERKLESARNVMSRLEGKVANMETETGTKKNQESILRELTEIRSCVENAATMMLETRKESVVGTPGESLSEEQGNDG